MSVFMMRGALLSPETHLHVRAAVPFPPPQSAALANPWFAPRHSSCWKKPPRALGLLQDRVVRSVQTIGSRRIRRAKAAFTVVEVCMAALLLGYFATATVYSIIHFN